VRAVLEDAKPDVVHLHEPLIPSLSLLALLRATAPTVGTFHAAASSSFAYSASRPVLARAVDRLDVRTAVSDAARALISRYFPGEYLLTPNGVDVARFASADPLDFGAEKSVLFFGRLEPRKGLEVLIRAMADVHAPGARLVVAGDGPQRRESRLLAERLEVNASFLGPLSEGDKPRAFCAAAVYCAPAIGRESFGIVLLEAMAAGAPVVCSDLPGFRSVCGDAAVYVQPNDPAALAVALRRVLTDDRRRDEMRAAGAVTAAKFDWSVLVRRVEDVYELASEVGARR
jgi:phosphatidylinositol alpha-mannosyltransferase